MARSLLAPTAFVTLLGLAPGCFRAAPAPVATADASTVDASPTGEAAAPSAEAAQAAGLVAYAATRSGNARAPSYDDAMAETKSPDDDPWARAAAEGAPQAVVLALEPALLLPLVP